MTTLPSSLHDAIYSSFESIVTSFIVVLHYKIGIFKKIIF